MLTTSDYVMPQVRRWQDAQRAQARKHGYVCTMLGRQRKLPAAMEKKNSAARGHALRGAINSPIQVPLPEEAAMSEEAVSRVHSR